MKRTYLLVFILALLFTLSAVTPLAMASVPDRDAGAIPSRDPDTSGETMTGATDPGTIPVSSTDQVVFDRPDLTVRNRATSVKVEGLESSGPIGGPMLPVLTRTFNLPSGVSPVVTFTPSYPNVEAVPYPVESMEAPRVPELRDPANTDPMTTLVTRGRSIYDNGQLWPASWYEVEVSQCLDPVMHRDTTQVTVHIFPVRYNPQTSMIHYIDSASISVSYEQESGTSSRSARADHYDLLIIAPAGFVSSLDSFVSHRNGSGMKCKVATLTQIYDGTYFTTQGSDNAEKMKYFIKNAKESWGITYVMLVGDRDQVPMRYAYCSGESTYSKWVPTDLYFSDLYYGSGSFAKWDSDGDGKYGENGDSTMDLRPDVYIARLPASSSSEVTSMLNNVISYETSTFGQDWFDNFVMSGTDTFNDGSGVAEGEYCLDQIQSNYMSGFTPVRRYQSAGTCTNTQIQTAINNGAGFAGFSDHGDNYGWGSTGGPLIYDKNDISGLSNGDKRPMVIVDACRTGVFDNGDTHSQTSYDGMVEYFVSSGHAIAGSGASRVSYGAYGTNYYATDSGYFNARQYQSYNIGGANARPGVMIAYAESAYVNHVPASYWSWADTKIVQEFVMFGDPTTQIGGFQYTTATMECARNESSVYPGQQIIYNITINNTGNAPAEIILSANANPTLPQGWGLNISQPTLSVPVGHSSEVYLTVSAPGNARAFESLRVDLVLSSANVLGTPLSIPTTTTVRLVSGFTMSCEPDTQSALPGTGTMYNVKLTNTGNYQDTVNLALTEVPDELTATLDNATISLGMGISGTLDLNVDVPDHTVAGEYPIVLSGYLFSDPAATHELHLKFKVLELNGLETGASTDHLEIIPGSTANFLLNLTNTGNHADEVSLEHSNPDELPTGWHVSFKPQPTLPIDAYSTTQANIRVSTTPESLAGNHLIKYRATLGSDSRTSSGTLKVSIAPRHEMELSCITDTIHLNSSAETGTFSIHLENLGNIMDTYQLSMVPNGTEAKLWTITMEKSVTLTPGQQSNISVELGADLTELTAGTYTMDLKALNPADNSTGSIVLKVVVDHTYGVGLDIPTRLQTLSSDSKANYEVHVMNLGNGEGEFKLSCPQMVGWSASFSPQTLTLGAFETGNATLELEQTSATPLAGNLDITLTASETDTEGTYQATRDITVLTPAFYSVALEGVAGTGPIPGGSMVADDLGSFRLKAGEVLEVHLKLFNNGNAPDTYTLSWLDDSGWGAPIPRCEVSPYSSELLNINLTVPDDAGPGEHTISIKTVSDSNSSVADTLVVSVTVQEKKDDPIIENPFQQSNSGAGAVSAWQLALIAAILAVLMLLVLGIVLIVRRRRSSGSPAVLAPVVTSNDRPANPTTPGDYYREEYGDRGYESAMKESQYPVSEEMRFDDADDDYEGMEWDDNKSQVPGDEGMEWDDNESQMPGDEGMEWDDSTEDEEIPELDDWAD